MFQPTLGSTVFGPTSSVFFGSPNGHPLAATGSFCYGSGSSGRFQPVLGGAGGANSAGAGGPFCGRPMGPIVGPVPGRFGDVTAAPGGSANPATTNPIGGLLSGLSAGMGSADGSATSAVNVSALCKVSMESSAAPLPHPAVCCTTASVAAEGRPLVLVAGGAYISCFFAEDLPHNATEQESLRPPRTHDTYAATADLPYGAEAVSIAAAPLVAHPDAVFAVIGLANAAVVPVVVFGEASPVHAKYRPPGHGAKPLILVLPAIDMGSAAGGSVVGEAVRSVAVACDDDGRVECIAAATSTACFVFGCYALNNPSLYDIHQQPSLVAGTLLVPFERKGFALYPRTVTRVVALTSVMGYDPRGVRAAGGSDHHQQHSVDDALATVVFVVLLADGSVRFIGRDLTPNTDPTIRVSFGIIPGSQRGGGGSGDEGAAAGPTRGGEALLSGASMPLPLSAARAESVYGMAGAIHHHHNLVPAASTVAANAAFDASLLQSHFVTSAPAHHIPLALTDPNYVYVGMLESLACRPQDESAATAAAKTTFMNGGRLLGSTWMDHGDVFVNRRTGTVDCILSGHQQKPIGSTGNSGSGSAGEASGTGGGGSNSGPTSLHGPGGVVLVVARGIVSGCSSAVALRRGAANVHRWAAVPSAPDAVAVSTSVMRRGGGAQAAGGSSGGGSGSTLLNMQSLQQRTTPTIVLTLPPSALHAQASLVASGGDLYVCYATTTAAEPAASSAALTNASLTDMGPRQGSGLLSGGSGNAIRQHLYSFGSLIADMTFVSLLDHQSRPSGATTSTTNHFAGDNGNGTFVTRLSSIQQQQQQGSGQHNRLGNRVAVAVALSRTVHVLHICY